ncbi:hypothetical protein [Citrobacter koseri]|uniref:hypothetical protein n=1 Tax=Citrobacter koseri TaxID=545 RepID=UPI0028BEBF70|nr:hypothetical protein [Citrobacter koseri]MDT7452746.1 hypothetical protein [Citrobacter koseri]
MSRGKFRKTARKIVAPPGNIAPCRPGKQSSTGQFPPPVGPVSEAPPGDTGAY